MMRVEREWARKGSNLRLPTYKIGTLTAELLARAEQLYQRNGFFLKFINKVCKLRL